MKRILTLGLVLGILSLLCVAQVGAQQNYGYTSEMSMEEYNAELEKWEQRLQEANDCVAQQEQEIASLKEQISNVEDQIASIRQETLKLLSRQYESIEQTEQALQKYLADLDQLIRDLRGLLALSPEELFQRRAEVDEHANHLDQLKQNPFSALDEAQEKIGTAEDLLQRIRAKMPKAMSDVYTVMRGDYLWRISGMQDIYNDPYQWVKIWTANRDQINNPNLIYPNQRFDIPRRLGPGKYVVQRGESLARIAGYGEVYGDPFQWQKLYDANKRVIMDPNTIYPHMILNVPQN
ncbi:MAG TPA: LysM peptidoglycan-binding domain-containing protein [bacterium]|nr:LysM peptidoglycan-binding domain-containing protein [bacterium]